jgi:hypothetical protein
MQHSATPLFLLFVFASGQETTTTQETSTSAPPPVPHDRQNDEVAAGLLGAIVCILIVLLFVTMAAAVKPRLVNRPKLVPEDSAATDSKDPGLPSPSHSPTSDTKTQPPGYEYDEVTETSNNPYRMFSYHEDIECKPQRPSQLAPIKTAAITAGIHCCAVCFEEKDTAKLEPRVFRKCQHALCIDCFGSMLVAQLKGSDQRDRLLRCPVCRMVFSELPSP